MVDEGKDRQARLDCFSNTVAPFTTFYFLHNLRIGPIDRVFAPGRPFKPSLMLVSKAIAYLSEAPFMRFNLG